MYTCTTPVHAIGLYCHTGTRYFTHRVGDRLSCIQQSCIGPFPERGQIFHIGSEYGIPGSVMNPQKQQLKNKKKKKRRDHIHTQVLVPVRVPVVLYINTGTYCNTVRYRVLQHATQYSSRYCNTRVPVHDMAYPGYRYMYRYNRWIPVISWVLQDCNTALVGKIEKLKKKKKLSSQWSLFSGCSISNPHCDA